MTDVETITGVLTEVKYQQNGFFIGRAKTTDIDKERFGIKGTMPYPHIGMEYILTGRWEHNPRYGKTFVFSEYRASYPKDLGAIRAYLMENCKWIGPEISKKLVREFGAKTLQTCKENPELIAAKIPGITPPRAGEIAAMLKDNEANEELQLAIKKIFDGIRISSRAVSEILTQYKGDAIAIIRQNPFRLIDDIPGVNFLTADRVARKFQYTINNPFRICAGILHALKEAAFTDGHTCLPISVLKTKTSQLLKVKPQAILKQIAALLKAGRLECDSARYSLPEFRDSEKTVGKILRRLWGRD